MIGHTDTGTRTMIPLVAITDKVFILQDRVLLYVLLLIIFLWVRSKLARQKLISPVPGIEMVPGGHWLFGHVKHLVGPIKDGHEDYFDRLFVDYANEQGLSCAYYFRESILTLYLHIIFFLQSNHILNFDFVSLLYNLNF